MIRKSKLDRKISQIGHNTAWLCNPVSKVTAHHYCHTLFSKSKSLGPAHNHLERFVHDHQEAGFIGVHLRSCLPYSCLMSLLCTSIQLIRTTNRDFESTSSKSFYLSLSPSEINTQLTALSFQHAHHKDIHKLKLHPTTLSKNNCIKKEKKERIWVYTKISIIIS